MNSFTLTRNDETKTFHTLADGWVQIIHRFNQIVETHVAECVNEWTGAQRFTGEIERQLVPSVSTSELKLEAARKAWTQLKKQGWA